MYNPSELRHHFGTRVFYSKPTKLKEKLGELKRKTADTKRAYTALITMVEKYLSGRPHDEIHDAANDVIGVVKDENLVGKKKVRHVGSILGVSINETQLAKMNAVIGKITDYHEQMEAKGVELADKHVPVQWDEPMEQTGEVIEAEDSDESSEDEADKRQNMPSAYHETREARTGEVLGSVQTEDYTETQYEIEPKEVDAYWLQKKLNEIAKMDAHKARELSNSILDVL